MKFTSKNSWEMRLNCGRRMEFQQEFLILSWVYFLPTQTSVKHWWMAFKKNIQELRQRSYDSSEQLRSMLGNPGFCPTQCGELAQNGSRAHFFGESKIWGERKSMKSMEDMSISWIIEPKSLREGSFGKASNLAIFWISVEFWPQKNSHFVLLMWLWGSPGSRWLDKVSWRCRRFRGEKLGDCTLDILMDGFWQQQKSAAWSFWGSF